jgi:CRISPR-associated protein Csm3
MRIGGVDKPVIKHLHSQEPYIPGSSIKGKVRSLLEMRSGLMTRTEGKPVSIKLLKTLQGSEKEICAKLLKLFGAGAGDSDEGAEELGPTRVSFADCPLNEEWKEKAKTRNLPLTEVKSENSINRIKGTAENPRFTERVPSSAVFDFSVTLKRLGDEDDLFEFLLQGLKLLEMDTLGGSGSRGYGRIVFEFDDEGIMERFEKIAPF